MRNKQKSRKLMRVKNKNRVNRIKNQQMRGQFILFLITLNFGELTTPEKVLARLRMHIEKLTGNTNFPVIDPTLVQLQAMADDIEAAIDEVASGNMAAIPTRDNLVADGLETIRQLSYHIQYLSKGDEVKIKSAGFDTRKPKGVSQSPGQVLNLVAKAVGPGKIKLTWDKEDHSTVYVVEVSTGGVPPALNWQAAGKTRNVSFIAEDLNPGQLYYFRVYGTNGNADGNPSDPAEQRSL